MVLTRTHTAEDLRQMAASKGDFELVEGELITVVPPGFDHASVQANILFALKSHLIQYKRGRVIGEAGFTLQHNPDTVLAPDVAFVSAERLPDDTSGFVELAPDLAVEIVSPGNSAGEIERKVAIYLQAGVQAIWVVYPRERQVVVHTPGNPPAVFTDADTVTGGDLLPGLTVPVAEIFA